MPPLLPIPKIRERLKQIFPVGLPNRNHLVGLAAARTVFAMFYIGAVAGSGRWLAPKQVYRMTDKQAALTSAEEREAYWVASKKSGYKPNGEAWYADNTREPIRDDSLKDGLAPLGAVVVNADIKTTANKGRYAMQPAFAALFHPSITDRKLELAVEAWRKSNLSMGAQARVAILMSGAKSSKSDVLIRLPNGNVRTMKPGLSSVITKKLVEEFLPRFLKEGAVLWISESGKKVVAEDFALAAKIGLHIKADKVLPDAILVDLGPEDPLLVFCEVVSTDGPVSETRREALLKIAVSGGYKPEQVAFVTAFARRDDSPFKKAIGGLAIGSFAWFINEPNVLMWIRGTDVIPLTLSELLAPIPPS